MNILERRFPLPVLGRNNIVDHLKNLATIGVVLLAAYWLVFIPVSYYIGLGVDIAEGAAHTLSK
jgi:hypothetical protein